MRVIPVWLPVEITFHALSSRQILFVHSHLDFSDKFYFTTPGNQNTTWINDGFSVSTFSFGFTFRIGIFAQTIQSAIISFSVNEPFWTKDSRQSNLYLPFGIWPLQILKDLKTLVPYCHQPSSAETPVASVVQLLLGAFIEPNSFGCQLFLSPCAFI